MARPIRTILTVLALAGSAALTACSDNDSTGVTPSESASVGGLTFSLSGAAATSPADALPAATAGFVAPLVTVDGLPTATQSRTITIGASEPFTSVFVQPIGSGNHVRIALPSPTTLIGIRVVAQAVVSSVATSMSIAVANGSRTSSVSVLTIVPFGN